ncbi:hypothetical protein D3C81_1956450 [compost metagenome]
MMGSWSEALNGLSDLIRSPVKALPYSNRLLSKELMCQSATATTFLASAGLARA